jgi:simple sugar transport system substrate-binding protein
MELRKLAIALASAAIVVAACAPAPAEPAPDPERAGITIEVVTHGTAADPFWSIFVNGVMQAGEDMGVTVTYSAPPTFDMVEMGRLIDAACAKNPSGLVVSLPDATALGPAITRCIQEGIPVISANTGADTYAALGILTHVGQDEIVAGRAAGDFLKAAGGTVALCVNHEVGNAALDARCNGFAETFAPGTVTVIPVDPGDPIAAQHTIATAIEADPTIDTMLTLGPVGSTPAIAALEQIGNRAIKFGTFDLSPEGLDAIEAGTMLFAIDQQQYLQGYLPIVALTLYNLYGLMPGGGLPVLTGPGFVTQEDVETVRAHTGTSR